MTKTNNKHKNNSNAIEPHQHKEKSTTTTKESTNESSYPYSQTKQEDLAQIGSLGPECDELKKKYDECFNNWFAINFLVHKQKDMKPCTELLKEYVACVKAAASKLGIPIDLTGCPPTQIHHHPGKKS